MQRVFESLRNYIFEKKMANFRIENIDNFYKQLLQKKVFLSFYNHKNTKKEENDLL